jgi:1,2-diacylglycerol 3-alpha-glucosyltransferase
MKITVVCDVLGALNNGTTIVALDLIKAMQERGHEVHVICPDASKKGMECYYVVPTLNFGVFQPIVDANGVALAKADTYTVAKAMHDADVVHIMMPFALGRKALKIARRLDKPVTAGFHVQAENVTAHFFWWIHDPVINHLVYLNFYNHFYKNVDAIHYPSAFIKGVFEKQTGKTPKGYVISNGIKAEIHHDPAAIRDPKYHGKFVIVCVGRLSKEKKQMLLVKAISLSAHEKDIQLVLCGEGPREKQILRYARKRLTNPPEVTFLKHDALNTLLNTCDLYGHASAVDIESMSLLEAETCGAIPLINAAKTSAMSAFSLDEHCVFKANSAKAMAERIDYFYEHPEVRKPLSERYVAYSKQFDYEKVMDEMEAMFKDVIAHHGSRMRK